jgi:hypothetical protein
VQAKSSRGGEAITTSTSSLQKSGRILMETALPDLAWSTQTLRSADRFGVADHGLGGLRR